MSGSTSRQKQKLLIMSKLFHEKTDDEHFLTVSDIIAELAQLGIKAERKTVYDDIDTLIESGLDIVIAKKSHSNAYYLGSRLFQDEELHVLADAVASSKFLTIKKSNELIKKLESLTSCHRQCHLRRNIYISNRVKSFDEGIYYSISSLNSAISGRKKIIFKYSSYNLQKKKQLRNGGEDYLVSPYYLIWENGNYYLVCFCHKREKICYYRVDRMRKVRVTSEKTHEPSESEADLAKQLRQTINMYGGEIQSLTLEMDKSLIDVIIERFGERIFLEEASENTFTVRIDVQISPTFWGWLFQFGDKAKILSPKSAVTEAVAELEKIMSKYKA